VGDFNDLAKGPSVQANDNDGASNAELRKLILIPSQTFTASMSLCCIGDQASVDKGDHSKIKLKVQWTKAVAENVMADRYRFVMSSSTDSFLDTR